MLRRVMGGTLVLTGVLGFVSAYALVQAPKADCASIIKDAPNDGVANLNPASTSTPAPNPLPGDPTKPTGGANEKGLDILAMTVRVTADRVYAYMVLNDIPDQPNAWEQAYQYDFSFAKGTSKKIKMTALLESTQAYWNHKLSADHPYPRAYAYDGINQKSEATGVTGDVDAGRDLVWVSVARSYVEDWLGPLTDGDKITDVTGTTYDYFGNNVGTQKRDADTTTVTGDAATQTVGDESCFTPAAITVTAGSVQFTDSIALSAKLTGEGNTALAGKAVTFTINGDSRSFPATTGDDGVARVTYPAIEALAGTHTVTVTYNGDESAARATATGTLVIKPETAKFKALKVGKAGAARTVTATLTDDDGHAVAGQKVDFYLNGAKKGTVVTNASGVAVFKNAKAGQKAQAKFAGAAGKYAAATSATATL